MKVIQHLRRESTHVQCYGKLPDIEPGSWGPCLWAGVFGDDPPEYRYYDDDDVACMCGYDGCDVLLDALGTPDPDPNPDDYVCICGVLNCTAQDAPKARQNKRHFPAHYYTDIKLVYGVIPLQGGYSEVSDLYEPLKELPRHFQVPPPLNSVYMLLDPELEGWVYAIAPNPDLSLHRIKLGWTAKPPGRRIDQYRTGNPNLLLLGLWESFAAGESAAFAACTGRIRDTEVFDVPDPWQAIADIGNAIAKYNTWRKASL